jgi:FkbM family methyltransferase
MNIELEESAIYRSLLTVRSPYQLWPLIEEYIHVRQSELGEVAPDKLLKQAGKIVVYGAGEFARAVISAWRRVGVAIEYLVDSDPNKVGETLEGYVIKSPDTLLSEGESTLVIIAAMNVSGLNSKLNEYEIRYLYAERDGSVGFFPGHSLYTNREKVNRLYEKLCDDFSREVIISVIVARIFQDAVFSIKGNLFTDLCSSYPQYFPRDIPSLRDQERYLDCGVFDGDSIVSFVCAAERQGVDDWSVMGIEADPENIELAKRNLKRFGIDDVLLINTAIGYEENAASGARLNNCRGGAYFEPSLFASIDEVAKEFKPTIIKMDIEGFEMAALIGAGKTIEEQRPRLAVCIYHSTLDLINIPLYIMEKYPFYDVRIRHHNAGSLWETVCYAY